MTVTKYLRPNLLGDLRAEADREMLGQVFLETADYRSLIETSDRIIVVGRRGTGKSALTLRLRNDWKKRNNTEVIKITPEEHQVIGIRPLVKLFGHNFNLIRAGSRLIWRYALFLESLECISKHYKYAKFSELTVLNSHLNSWRNLRGDLVEKVRTKLKSVIDNESSPEELIGDLSGKLELTDVEAALAAVNSELDINIVFLIDRLDEGYEPDEIGIGIVDGLIQAAIDTKTRFPNIKPIVFLRDNIFRSVQKNDPDYSRNIEGHVLRLHWDDRSLLNFAARRMRLALEIDQESSLKIWNKCTAGDLKGMAGFQKCLQFTLYRPRDLLALLNEAFFNAGRKQRIELVSEDLEETARSISQNRLDDLKKEYTAVLPGLPKYIGAFHAKTPQQDVNTAIDLIQEVLSEGSDDPLIQQDFLIMEDANTVIRGLYSVGFLGIREPTTGSFIFCHDGRAPDREFSVGDKILVHPCYWNALNCSKSVLVPEEAEEIYDEYDIEVSSETPVIRNNKIKQLIAELDQIPEGMDGSGVFEEWCHRAVRICFAKGLHNVELKPNNLAKSRRDIVATNLGEGDVWERIYNDYGTRQVTFEVKNYKSLKAADYQQIQSYLTGEYGRLAFVITRDDSVDLYANKDVEWIRDLYANHGVLIIKLTAKYFSKLLYKLRSPQKHDDVNNSIHKLLDTYTRLYIAGQTPSGQAGKLRKRKRSDKKKEKIEGSK